MIYTQLLVDYKYEVIAEAVHGREIEHFHYDFDRVNFEHLLETLPDGEYKENLRQRHSDTLKQIATVDAIHKALMAQVDDVAAYAEAVERVIKKRNEVKA